MSPDNTFIGRCRPSDWLREQTILLRGVSMEDLKRELLLRKVPHALLGAARVELPAREIAANLDNFYSKDGQIIDVQL